MKKGVTDGTDNGLIDIPGADRTVWAVSTHHTLDAAGMAFIEERRAIAEKLTEPLKAHRTPDARVMVAGSREGVGRFFLELAWS
jgi:hypothetical protein